MAKTSKDPKAPIHDKASWLENMTKETGLDTARICGCKLRNLCDCDRQDMVLTAGDLKSLNKQQLFYLYIRTCSDEMSPVMWRGLSKSEIVQMFLEGESSVKLTPFY